MKSDYLHALATFVVETPTATIPLDVRERAQQMIADCVGCMLAGGRAPQVRRLAAIIAARSGIEEACAIGQPMHLPVEQAAYLGGIAGTWHDLDEGNLHTRTHAAIQIVPVLLAEVQRCGVDGRAFVDAFVVAYEVVSRLWRATTVRLAVHPHGTTGALAGALALARVRGLDVPSTAAAMNLALALGGVSSRRTLNDGATVRNVFTGSGARAAFEAMTLLEAGFSGESNAPASVLGAIYGDAFDPAAAVHELGATWWLRKNYFKRFASARYLHGALDLLESIAADETIALQAETIERIDVETYFMAATMAQQHVNSAFGMRFSLPAAMATRIVHGPSPLTDEPSAAFEDPRVHQLAKRIFVHENKRASAQYPVLQPSRLKLHYRDGRKFEVAAERIVGESDYPLPAGELRRKFIELSAPSIGEPVAAEAWGSLMALDSVTDVALLCASWNNAAQSRAARV